MRKLQFLDVNGSETNAYEKVLNHLDDYGTGLRNGKVAGTQV